MKTRKSIKGTEIKQGDIITIVSCRCCFYKIIIKDGELWPEDDGGSRVHGVDFDVWGHEVEIIEDYRFDDACRYFKKEIKK